MQRSIGVDFGTTNSAVALAYEAPRGDAPPAQLVRFRASAEGDATSETFRSVLFFEVGRAPALAGPLAIERFLSTGGAGRLLQSLKSFLASPLFSATTIEGQRFTLEELIGALLRCLRSEAERSVGPLGERAVFGRPVRFVSHSAEHGDPEAESALALERLRKAAALAGWSDVTFEYEPLGAALHYERSLDHDERVLIADFGGGTTDFTLLEVGPGVRSRAGARAVLGTEGVGVAGDALDARLVGEVVAPALGRGGHYRSYFDKKRIAIPPWPYEHLARWHHLSFLKSQKTLHFLREMRAQAEQPEALERLLHVVEADLGYPLYRSVERAKFALTAAPEARFAFDDDPVHLATDVAREAFERWIDPELVAIDACVERLLARTGLAAREVDRVFLTGGSSLVPAVRRRFAARFGDERLRSGGELTSVASGLALRAAELFA